MNQGIPSGTWIGQLTIFLKVGRLKQGRVSQLAQAGSSSIKAMEATSSAGARKCAREIPDRSVLENLKWTLW